MVTGIIVVGVVVLMAVKEIAGSINSERAHRVASFLTVPVIGLSAVFVITFVITVIKLLA